MQRTLVVLTGGAGSGKSTAAKYLSSLGVSVVDADQLAREAMAPGRPGAEKVMAKFGTLDREKLRQSVFADERKRLELEAILHPAIRALALEKLKQIFGNGKTLAVYEAPVYFEARLETALPGELNQAKLNCDVRVLLVDAAPETRISRMLARQKGLDRETAEKILAAQLSSAEKIKMSNWVIENNSSIDALHDLVQSWLSENFELPQSSR